MTQIDGLDNILCPKPKPGLLDIVPYRPGKSGEIGKKVYKLSANESPLGASPKACAALVKSVKKPQFYPEGSARLLRQAIAARFALKEDHIVCGAGSDQLLQILAAAYLSPGDEAVYSQYGFLVYSLIIKANGATPIIAPEYNYCARVDNLLACVTPRTKILFLANPNNPTGTYLPISEINRLHQNLPKSCLLVIDAAYADYVQHVDYEAGIALVHAYDNVVMVRTFSKIHGLASLRIGWAYCPAAIADILNRLREPFNVSTPAIAAGAASMEDQNFIEEAVAHNDYWRDWLGKELRDLGLEIIPSAGNFLLVNFPYELNRTAEAADQFLTKKSIIVRALQAYNLPNSLRITIGTAQANKAVVAAFKKFL